MLPSCRRCARVLLSCSLVLCVSPGGAAAQSPLELLEDDPPTPAERRAEATASDQLVVEWGHDVLALDTGSLVALVQRLVDEANGPGVGVVVPVLLADGQAWLRVDPAATETDTTRPWLRLEAVRQDLASALDDLWGLAAARHEDRLDELSDAYARHAERLDHWAGDVHSERLAQRGEARGVPAEVLGDRLAGLMLAAALGEAELPAIEGALREIEQRVESLADFNDTREDGEREGLAPLLAERERLAWSVAVGRAKAEALSDRVDWARDAYLAARGDELEAAAREADVLREADAGAATERARLLAMEREMAALEAGLRWSPTVRIVE